MPGPDNTHDTAPETVGVPAAVRHAWTDLADTVRSHQFAYHVHDAPTISDGDYDALIREPDALRATAVRVPR